LKHTANLCQKLGVLLLRLHTRLRALALVCEQPPGLVKLPRDVLSLLLQAAHLQPRLLQLRLRNLGLGSLEANHFQQVLSTLCRRQRTLVLPARQRKAQCVAWCGVWCVSVWVLQAKE
jgi:hypothetical protein